MKPIQIKTKHLVLTQAPSDAETGAETAAPGRALWRIAEKKTGAELGRAGFGEGPDACSAALVFAPGTPLFSSGRAAEALEALCGHALDQEGTFFVVARVPQADTEARRALEASGFKAQKGGGDIVQYERGRDKSAWIGVYMCLGLGVGLSLGTAFEKGSLGMTLGLCIGLAVGAALDASENKKRVAAEAVHRAQAD